MMENTPKLSKDQIQHFAEFGYLTCHSGIDDQLLKRLDDQVDDWIELSRQHESNFGTTVDSKARFDLEVGHTRENP